ncbi:hypothetical protein M8C13_40330 [Crossiella sp. SN42]|uniref:hypothetical protein n=1 Tax=Crossiella sp. SN42 TaxID=2944808 RepID=UPI00207D6ABC|nr:hypothetical protein [Crossiella sp. SN42]MCO1582015.1 hypothetical protein [Crossiella sp. SN42]
MSNEVERISRIGDPYELIRAATVRLNAAQEEVTQLAQLRRRKIQELNEQGVSLAAIAEEVGLSKARIHQVRRAGPPPEGAFLGIGSFTVLTPLKQDTIQGRPVVAMEDVAATQKLGELAQSLGLGFTSEHIPVGGAVNLNRGNLVVICGPRISQPVASVLASDPFLQFEREENGPWTIRDSTTGAAYRSGWDRDPHEPYDFAYLGRLNRPDGDGSLIVFTGIHPPGSLGVVKMLSTRIAEMYGEVRDKNFSTLVRTEYDFDTREPLKVDLVTPMYLHTEG